MVSPSLSAKRALVNVRRHDVGGRSGERGDEVGLVACAIFEVGGPSRGSWVGIGDLMVLSAEPRQPKPASGDEQHVPDHATLRCEDSAWSWAATKRL